jgi:MFS transporter, BCD family, chlorophyll transporter
MLIGLGGGIFGHGTLTLTMRHAPKEQAGLALGTWGAVQATAAGLAVALGGIGRDVVDALARHGVLGADLAGPAVGYVAVYTVEIVLLVITVGVMRRLVHGAVAVAVAVVHPTQTAGQR